MSVIEAARVPDERALASFAFPLPPAEDHVMDDLHDRRRRRSEATYEAIFHQLEHLREAQHLQSFVLGDESGLVLAGVGDQTQASVLAAYAPVLHVHRDDERRDLLLQVVQELIPNAPLDTLRVRRFALDGETLYLCSLGENAARAEASLYRAVTGIRRIMQQTAEAA